MATAKLFDSAFISDATVFEVYTLLNPTLKPVPLTALPNNDDKVDVALSVGTECSRKRWKKLLQVKQSGCY